MNSNVIPAALVATGFAQSSQDQALAQLAARRPRRTERPWSQRAGVALCVLLMQVAIGIALVRTGYVKVPPLPGKLTLVDIQENHEFKEPPPPREPQPVVIIPVEVPIEIDVASETAITLPEVAPKAPPAQPVQPSTGRDRGAVMKSYQMALMRHLDAHKRYPNVARTRRNEGVIVVRFTMDREGRVLSASLVKSSTFELLDVEGVALPDRASPLPAPPPELAGNPVSLVVPVEYFLE